MICFPFREAYDVSMSWRTWVNISCFQLSLLLRCFEINGKKRPSTCCRWDDGTKKWLLSWVIMKSRQLAKHQERQERYKANSTSCKRQTMHLWYIQDLVNISRFGLTFPIWWHLFKSVSVEVSPSRSPGFSFNKRCPKQEIKKQIMTSWDEQTIGATWKCLPHSTKASSVLLSCSWMTSEFVKTFFGCFWMFWEWVSLPSCQECNLCRFI